MATISLSSATISSITVDIAHNGNMVDNWKLFCDGTLKDSSPFTATTSHSATGKKISGLSAGQKYTIKVEYYRGSSFVHGASGSYSTLPDSLSGLSVSTSGYAPNASVKATWSSSTGATGYSWSAAGQSGAVAAPTTEKSINVSSAGLYSFSVTPYNGSGSGSDDSKPFSVYNPPNPPSSMSGYVTVSKSQVYAPATITFDWSNYSGNATSYDISTNTGTNNNITFKSYSIGQKQAGTFSITVTPRNGDGTGDSGSASITLTDPPPQGTPSVSATPRVGKKIDVSWTSVSGATGYVVYANDGVGSGDYNKGNTSTTSLSITVDRENWPYTIKVVPYNSIGNGGTGIATVTTLDETPPSDSGTLAVTDTTESKITIRAYNAVDSGSGIQGWKLYLAPGQDVQNIGNHYTGIKIYGTDQTYTFSGLNQDTDYTIAIQAFDNANNSANSMTVQFARTKISVPTDVVVTSRFEGGFYLSWGSVPGATNYELNYKKSTDLQWNILQTTTLTTSTFNIGQFGIMYDFKVRAYKGGSWGSFSAVSSATTNPRTPTLVGEYSGVTATITVNGMTGSYNDIVIERRLKSTDSIVDTKTVGFYGGYAQWTIASNVKDYIFKAYSRLTTSSGATLNSCNYSNIIEFTRPLDFAWKKPKVQGQLISSNLTYDEWNAFTARINEFRTYTGTSVYSFTSVSSGMTITADIFNQATRAIRAITPPIAPPADVEKNKTPITAKIFNDIRDSLNSIL